MVDICTNSSLYTVYFYLFGRLKVVNNFFKKLLILIRTFNLMLLIVTITIDIRDHMFDSYSESHPGSAVLKPVSVALLLLISHAACWCCWELSGLMKHAGLRSDLRPGAVTLRRAHTGSHFLLVSGENTRIG